MLNELFGRKGKCTLCPFYRGETEAQGLSWHSYQPVSLSLYENHHKVGSVGTKGRRSQTALLICERSVHRRSFHLQDGCSIAKFLVDSEEACALCLLPIPFSYSVLVPDVHFEDLPPLEKSATMGFPVSFIFPLSVEWM